MLSKILSYALNGIDGFLVEVEVDITGGLPKFELVGLGDTAIKESKERVRSAIRNSGYKYPAKAITINLAPADLKKEGPFYDLAIAVGIINASAEYKTEVIAEEKLKEYVMVGELSLDGNVKHVKGILPILISARKAGYKKFILPEKNCLEASYISGIEIYGVKTLCDAVEFLRGEKEIEPAKISSYETGFSSSQKGLDFSFVKGQARAKRALEIAAAGGHNVLMIGPPGSGKSMLAKCFPSILPDLTFEESLEVTKIHSVAGELDYKQGIIKERPCRTPHHSATAISLTGGGMHAKPGEISLAHNGVLYLDEMPEYSRHTLEMLRQPLEDGVITVARAERTISYPANFTLIASMNPCPCGYYGSKSRECKCSPAQIHKYLSRISGPILDRIDIHVEVDNVTFDDLRRESVEEPSASIKERVNKAREIQLARFKNSKNFSNAKMSVPATKKFCTLSTDCEELLKVAFENLKLSARAHDRILKVARTIADLEGCENIEPAHIAEAIGYRSLDRKYL